MTDIDRERLYELARDARHSLTERDVYILAAREAGHSRAEIGRVFGIGAERVRVLEKAARARIADHPGR